MADIKISELTQAESLSTSDLLESAVPYNGGFLSRRMSLAQLSNYLENYVQHQALTTTAKTIVSAINEVLGDLANYYTISQTYSKTEVDTLIAGVSGLHFEVVQQLPTSDIDMNTIYLVPKQDSGQQDVYDEFICLDNTTTPATWEKIGTTEIDLSDYVTDTELTTILNDYVTSSGLSTILASYATTSAMTTALADKVDKVSGKGLSTEDYTTAEKAKLNGISSGAEVNVQSDWNQTDNTKDDFIKNKPTIPTSLSQLTDDENHRLVTDEEKSTWDAKAETSDITSAINDLDVASTSIGQGETLATIKEENGKIAVTKQNISITNKQIANYCLVGTSNAISGSNTWHKVASVILDVANEDEVIMLAVNDTFPPDTDAEPNGGILYCRARQNALGVLNYAKLKFVGNSGFDAKNFRLYYTIVSDTSITVEIWTSLSRRYAFRRFVVLSMGNRWQSNLEKWTLYNSTSPSAAPTESATCVRVDCEDNTYKQTDNNILGAKNLARYPYYGGNNYSRNNVTISVDTDGVITATGSNPSSAFGYSIAHTSNPIIIDPTQSYIVSGLSGGSSTTVRILIDLWTAEHNPSTDTRDSRLYLSSGSTTIPIGYKYVSLTLYFYTSAGNLFPLTVKPMLRLASIADNTFKPYADTNRNLSMNKANLRQIATVELTNTASKAYNVGDYMIWENKLCVVRVEIASGGAITLDTNVEATDLGSEVKKSKIWGNENIATIPNSSSSSKVYVTTSAYATEIYVQKMNIRSTSLGINETGYCSVTIPILPSMTNNYFVFMFRGDVDNKLYDGRLLFKKDSNGVYGYVSKVYQDGVLKSANDLEADIVVFEKS